MAETSGDPQDPGLRVGIQFERTIHEIMDRAAAQWGDRYTKTGTVPGLISRCKKGDGVLETLEPSLLGRHPRVVVEMSTDSTNRRDWFDYLDEALHNRDAQTAMGIVLGAEVPGGGPVRSYGFDKIVVAYDPEQDDPRNLYLPLYLMRCQAISAVSRWRSAETRRTAEQTIELATLTERKLESVKVRFTEVQRCASKGLSDVDALRSAISHLVSEFLGDLENPDSEA